MDAKAYDKKTAAFAGYLLQNVPEIDGRSMNYWMNNPAALKQLLGTLQREPSLFSLVATNSMGGGHISTLILERDALIDSWVRSLLGVGPGTRIGTLSSLLLESDYFLSWSQVDEMVRRTNAGDHTMLHTDGRANFYFSRGAGGSVSVGRISSGSTGWYRRDYPLDSTQVWSKGVSLLVQNLDRSKL